MLHHSILADHTFYSLPAPSGGPTLLFMLGILQHYGLNMTSDLNLTYHRLVETFKFAYAERTKLGDPHCDDLQDQICIQSRELILRTQRDMFKSVVLNESMAVTTRIFMFHVTHVPVSCGYTHMHTHMYLCHVGTEYCHFDK